MQFPKHGRRNPRRCLALGIWKAITAYNGLRDRSRGVGSTENMLLVPHFCWAELKALHIRVWLVIAFAISAK